MLPTFVIGLREGLEAALIVGIIAAFLRKQGRRDLVRWVLVGVGVAVALCVGAGVALELYSENLPQREQEALETVVGVLAVCMVTYMVVWMRRNSRHLKGQLEGMAAGAIAAGSAGFTAGRAMVLMAFLAVIREGLETVVFLLAAFNESGSGPAAGLGAVLGIAVAVGLGYGIYRGGVHLNLSKFFRFTGVVLVLVAAGLVVNALHTAHEAGWINFGQGSTVDLTWLAEPGTVQASLLTGMLGIQSKPVTIEVIGWLLYLVPVGLYVASPPGKAVPMRKLSRVGAGIAAVAAVAAIVLVWVAPDEPVARPVTTSGTVSAQVVIRSADAAIVRTQQREPVNGTIGAASDYRLRASGRADRGGVSADVFRTALVGSGAIARPARVDLAAVARRNGGRLPIGIAGDGATTLAATYSDLASLTVWLDSRTDRVLDLVWSERVMMTVRSATGTAVTLDAPVASAHASWPAETVRAAAAAAREDHAALDERSLVRTAAAWCVAIWALALVCAVGFAVAARRRERPASLAAEPHSALVNS